ncbi:MAG: radical SAM protein [Promethearchaeota archaeon]
MENNWQLVINNPRQIFSLNDKEIKELAKMAFDKRFKIRGKNIHFFAPTFTLAPYEIEGFIPSGTKAFENISLTGTKCELQCEHCKGYLLEFMVDAHEKKLEDLMQSMIKDGTKGFLISGGSDIEGKVPFGKYIDDIKAIKDTFKDDIKIVIHSGYMNQDEIREIARTRIDGLMFDFIGSSNVIKKICHLNYTPKDYLEMVKTCNELHMPVMPHVILGLDHGHIDSEIKAIKLLSRYKLSALVLVILMPFPNTPMKNVIHDDPEIFQKIILLARIIHQEIPVVLGCAKPASELREISEAAAIEAGYDGIAFPLQETFDLAVNLGYNTIFHEQCCSLINKYLNR